MNKQTQKSSTLVNLHDGHPIINYNGVTAVANDNQAFIYKGLGKNDSLYQKITQVGYYTKAGHNLFMRIRFLGVTQKTDYNNGQPHYSYLSAVPLPKGTFYENEKEIIRLNEKGTFKAIFGNMNFPTGEDTPTNELEMIFQNKKTLGIASNWIKGRSFDIYGSRYLDCSDGDQVGYHKNALDPAFVSFQTDYPVI